MKIKNRLLTIGVTSLAAVTFAQGSTASPTKESEGRTISRLHQIRADYLIAIGKREQKSPTSVQVAQWMNFPNFPNFQNWFNGWRNF